MDRRSAVQTLMMAAAVAPLAGRAARAGTQAPVPGSGYVPATGDPSNPPKQKMILVGAGSAMFTQGIIIDWIKQQPEGDWEIALVDINPVILEATEKMVRKYMEAADRPARITASCRPCFSMPARISVSCGPPPTSSRRRSGCWRSNIGRACNSWGIPS